MKTINKIFTLLFIVTIIFSCGNDEQQTEEEVSTKNLTIANYAIEGMVCAMGCAGTIEKEVDGMAGVIVSDVDYEAGKAHFEFDESIVSEKEIIAKIEEIANGQYKVLEWVENGNYIEDEEESEGNDESVTEVSLPSFEVPNLFTLLMDQI
ncbi:MAG: hypothetical protein COA97_06065 [Flavobacteriales bacterium]|nr:MAG: hypothetical protein COA97_06065 [Flavobacteriales bacterium]